MYKLDRAKGGKIYSFQLYELCNVILVEMVTVVEQSLHKAMKNKKKRLDTVVTYIYLYKYSLHELAISIISILTNMKDF